MQTDIVNTVTVLEYISPPPLPDIYREKAAVVRDNRTTHTKELGLYDGCDDYNLICCDVCSNEMVACTC